MKNSHIPILLILLVVLLTPAATLAIIAPHDASNDYRCSVCHNTHTTLGTTGFNNICVSCHNGSDPKAYKRFAETDAANPYGTITSHRITTPYQTSHNWAGSDVNPAAGAKAPTSADMNTTATIKGLLLCVRCHSVHGERESAANSAPFLRTLNDNDQMCRDCHTVRDTSTHMTGSHPININYTSSTSKVKLNPAGFNQTPINANPANPTSAVKLINGAIQCSTCHGVHYTDSRSGTLDHFSSSSFNRLSTSRGFLLRTDARGKTANDINICTNCHAGKKAHNGTGQNIQCNDCHSGHVEYDPQAVSAEEKKPNLFVLRRYMNVSTVAGRNTKVRTFYRYTGSQKELYRGPAPADGAVGVCQACHNDKAGFKSGHYVDPLNPGLGIKDERKQCASCHNHEGNFGCSSCHGFPPKINARGTDGYAFWSTATNQASRVYPLDESRTPHSTHADGKLYKIECYQCHKGNVNHNTGNFQQVFLDKNGIVAGTAATYTAGTRTCSSTYCHSNAKAVPAYQPLTWAENKDSIVKGANRCQKCHADKDTTASLSDAHDRHAASGNVNYACQNCHALTLAATFENNTGLIYPSAKHVNGTKDVKYDFPGNATLDGYLDPASYNAGLKTCTTVYCHSNGAGNPAILPPVWNNADTGKCGTCHGVLGPASGTRYGVINSNAHFEHLSSSYGPRFITATAPNACLKCHSSYSLSGGETKHIDGNKTPSTGAGTDCYKCHGGLQQGPLPTWSDNSRIACTKCHPIWNAYSASRIGTVLAPKQVNYSTSGHGKKAAPYNKMACTACHDQNSAHISNPPLLGDNKRLIAVNYTAARRGGTNAICGKCHWAGQSAENKVRFTHVTSVGEAQNGTPTMACSRCHNVHGTSNFGMINNQIVFNSLSAPVSIVYQSPYSSVGLTKVTKPGPYNFIQTTAPYRGICQVCHTKAMHFQRGRDEAANGPANGINTNTGGSIVSHKNFNQSTNCLSCHSHTPPPTSPGTYAFYPFGQCNACHGYPPVPKSFVPSQNNYSSGKFEDYTGGGGAHIVAGHVPASANPSQSWSLCNSCHNESDHLTVPTYPQVKVSINSSLQFSQNQTIQTKYTSNRLGGTDHRTGTCSNVSCHFQRTPAWGSPSMP